MKFTEASDDAYDKKHGIKEGSKTDIKLDASRGVTETDMTHPFGHPSVRAQRDQMKGHAKATVSGEKKPAMKSPKDMNFGKMPAKIGKSFKG